MAAAPPLALWGALIFLFVTNGVTLYALTGLNVRYDQLQTDCSAELSERDLLLQTASVCVCPHLCLCAELCVFLSLCV